MFISNDENTKVLNKARSILSNYASHLLVMCNFNFPEINWSDGTSSTDPDHQAARFLENVRGAFLFQHLTNLTHFREDQTANILYLFFTNKDNMISDLRYTSPLGKSHHVTLEFEFYSYRRPVVELTARFTNDIYNWGSTLAN